MPANELSSCGEEGSELRRGPWTFEEDSKLIRYITCHGEGRWNLLANSSGLRRTGKSCRLRWLNYLKPDIKRGNLTPQEQLLILELHSKWGNRWSKIAAHLPGRTDNEIKNYWRTRVQKQARQLKINSNSKKFIEALQHFWMPRLLEKMEQNSAQPSLLSSPSTKETENSESGSKLTNSIAIGSSSQNSMAILEQTKSSDYENPLENNSYHVDSTGFAKESFRELDISDLESNEFSFSDCQMAKVDWTNDIAGAFWDIGESWEFLK
ncbi:hypothetical protein DCAR_0727129 [Daucus carota subsp. sativus]|uniref:Uncharacterized protein n=1 Tax=Daucus carota subsp. sativus TaxID=79200 RepID=A0A164SRA2_DAUCS|nr:PREDICTED: transcription factor MYB24-like [Daucus carota subsp. sativus]WOH07696.1 hypothetical protein DCAR_0727129 [Daucus carota subsp. sativus]